MKSIDLVQAMRDGATLKARWKPRSIQKPKKLYILTYPDGKVVNVQRSLVDAAIKAKSIRAISRMGDTYDYEITNA